MAEFYDLNARLTEACKTRLGELASVTLSTGTVLEGTRVIVDREREFVGQSGQVSDMRTTVKVAKIDLSPYETIEGATVKLARTGEELYCDAVVGDDGEFMEAAVR